MKTLWPIPPINTESEHICYVPLQNMTIRKRLPPVQKQFFFFFFFFLGGGGGGGGELVSYAVEIPILLISAVLDLVSCKEKLPSKHPSRDAEQSEPSSFGFTHYLRP